MFPIGRLLCKRRDFLRRFQYFEENAIADQSLFLLQQLHDSSPMRFLSVSSTCQNRNQCDEQEQSLKVVSYLVNSCGLSPDSAIYASKRVPLINLEKSESVVHLLKIHGFSQIQISGMIRKSPPLLLSNPEKTLLPKLNYLYSVGASRADVVKIFSCCPGILRRSLQKHIIPSFDLLRDLVGTDKMAIATINSYAWLLVEGIHRNFIPNLKTLRVERASESGISYLVKFRPSALLIPSSSFDIIVEKVKAFGFSPSSSLFVIAVQVISSMSKSTWEKKLGIFSSWGWSQDITYQAFKRYPYCMALSEDNIMAKMDFFVNRAGTEASYIARNPLLLSYSLEKRVIPRYTINQILLSRGLMKIANYSLSSLLIISNQSFKEKFVVPYLEEAPELLDLFMAKTN